MFKNQRELKQFGHRLMDLLHRHFIGSKYGSESKSLVYQSLFADGGISFEFRRWANKPAYIILYNNRRYVFELDLSRIIESEGRYDWYLSQPTHRKNIKMLRASYKWCRTVPLEYRQALRTQKSKLHSGSQVAKSGFVIVNRATKNEIENEFVDLIDEAIQIHTAISTRKGQRYSLDDARAMEGYQKDRQYLQTVRNKNIVKRRKQKDNYTCQVCGYRLELNNHFIIECHHTKPLQDGRRRITNIAELVCLCPTCHRIVHTQNPPLTVADLKIIRKKSFPKMKKAV